MCFTIKSSTSKKRRVHFAEDPVTVVVQVELVSKAVVQELFYTERDFRRFRYERMAEEQKTSRINQRIREITRDLEAREEQDICFRRQCLKIIMEDTQRPIKKVRQAIAA